MAYVVPVFFMAKEGANYVGLQLLIGTDISATMGNYLIMLSIYPNFNTIIFIILSPQIGA